MTKCDCFIFSRLCRGKKSSSFLLTAYHHRVCSCDTWEGCEEKLILLICTRTSSFMKLFPPLLISSIFHLHVSVANPSRSSLVLLSLPLSILPSAPSCPLSFHPFLCMYDAVKARGVFLYFIVGGFHQHLGTHHSTSYALSEINIHEDYRAGNINSRDKECISIVISLSFVCITSGVQWKNCLGCIRVTVAI